MRKIVYDILYKVETQNSYINILLKDLKYDPQIMKGISVRVYGVATHDIYLEYIINELINQKLKQKEMLILKLAFFEKLYLDSVPDYAIISEYINLTKKKAPKATKLISYILNNYLEQATKIIPTYANELKNIAILTSTPLWMVKKIEKQYPNNYQDILEENLTKKENTARVTKKLINPQDFKPFLFEDLVISQENIIKSEDFIKKNIIIQDLGSYLISKVVDAQSDEIVLDLCAAPGNKTLHLAETAKLVVANELYESRFNKLVENIQEHEKENITTVNCDGGDEKAIKNLSNHDKFDKILIDVPCSGWGVIRSKPETKKYQKMDEINNIINVQEELLSSADKLIKENGIITYSTCTFNQEENENQIKKFCEKHNYEVIENDLCDKIIDNCDNGYTLLPMKYHTTSFFICNLKRK